MTARSLAAIRIGSLHSQVGDNDGVSIVIGQIVEALGRYAGVQPERLSFACGRCGAAGLQRVWQDAALWHRDPLLLEAMTAYEREPPPAGLEAALEERIAAARRALARYLDQAAPDALIVHNSCHPVNLIYGVALARLLHDRRQVGRETPRYLLWWHDSHLERARFARPSRLLARYLAEGVPGPQVDGLVFINQAQWPLARSYFASLPGGAALAARLERAQLVVPNTCEVPGDWDADPDPRCFAPRLDPYNADLLAALGITQALAARGRTLADAVLLLQHTRVVARKRIDQAIDFAFALAAALAREGLLKDVFLIVSGSSGDEPGALVAALEAHLRERRAASPGCQVELVWGEGCIGAERSAGSGEKRYAFAELPGVVAAYGGLGTYFSEVEGFGNNLLEMMSLGLPVVVRRYPVFVSDIAPYGFELPSTPDDAIPAALVSQALALLRDPRRRRQVVQHNLARLRQHLSHEVIAQRLALLWQQLT